MLHGKIGREQSDGVIACAPCGPVMSFEGSLHALQRRAVYVRGIGAEMEDGREDTGPPRVGPSYPRVRQRREDCCMMAPADVGVEVSQVQEVGIMLHDAVIGRLRGSSQIRHEACWGRACMMPQTQAEVIPAGWLRCPWSGAECPGCTSPRSPSRLAFQRGRLR